MRDIACTALLICNLAIPIPGAAAPQPSVQTLPPIRMPIDGVKPRDLHDTYLETHNGHIHEAVDILAPRRTPVHAVVNGLLHKFFLSKAGGNTIYEFDETETYCFYYAHLDSYAEGVKEGDRVQAGDVIAYVGTTGNADPGTPHLHFAAYVLGPGKEYWKGEPINPFSRLMEALRNAGALSPF